MSDTLLDDIEPDDDAGDDGRENAVDEDKLNADEEDDLDGDDPSLEDDEARTLRDGLSASPAGCQPVRAQTHLNAG